MKRIEKKLRSYDEDVDKKNISKLRFYSFYFLILKMMHWGLTVILLAALTCVFKCDDVSDAEGWLVENTDYNSQVSLLQRLIKSEMNKEREQKQFEEEMVRLYLDPSSSELRPVPRKKSYLWFRSKQSANPVQTVQTRVSIGQSLQPPPEETNKPKSLFRYGKKWVMYQHSCVYFSWSKKNQIYYGGALVLINTAHKELIHVYAGVLITCLWCKQYLYFIQKLLESNFLLLGFSFQILKNNWDEVIMLNVFIEFW